MYLRLFGFKTKEIRHARRVRIFFPCVCADGRIDDASSPIEFAQYRLRFAFAKVFCAKGGEGVNLFSVINDQSDHIMAGTSREKKGCSFVGLRAAKRNN